MKICRPHDTARAAGAKIREVVGLCSGPNQNSLHVSSDLIRTRAVRVQALGALKQNGRALQYAAQEMKADPAIVLTAVRQNGQALEYADTEMKADRYMVLEAVMQNPRALDHAAKEMRRDHDIVLEAVYRELDRSIV